MSATSGAGNPLIDMWLTAQRQFLDAQEPLAGKLSGLPNGDAADIARQAEAGWKEVERQAKDWVKTASRLADVGKGGPEGVAEETLRRMLDPTRFLYAGSDEVNIAIQRLVEGPEFSDFEELERKVLKATKEWLDLSEASARYRGVTAAAWARAFDAFTRELAANPEAAGAGLREMTDRWLAIANEELIRTQRTDEFLDAQRKLLRAGVDYRLKERELVEAWCEAHSIPTRSEVDELHRAAHDLRRQLREAKRRLAALEAKPKRAAPRPRGAAAKTRS